MRGAVWMVVCSTCLLAVAVNSVIIRNWRHKARLVPVDTQDGTEGRNPTSQTPAPKPKKGFRPTPSRCCKIGEKVAKRKLSCEVRILEVVRKYNDMQRTKFKYNRPRKVINSKFSIRLSNKLRKCSASFPKYFEKCCKYREQFFNNMAKCKKRRGKERRQCRQSIRKRYKKSPESRRIKQRKTRRRKNNKQ